jgi:hypothetical protein
MCDQNRPVTLVALCRTLARRENCTRFRTNLDEWDVMPIATTYAELRRLSDGDLVKQYDDTAQTTQIGLDFLRQELARREAEQQQEAVFRLTKQMRDMTVVITVLTILNVALVAIALFH